MIRQIRIKKAVLWMCLNKFLVFLLCTQLLFIVYSKARFETLNEFFFNNYGVVFLLAR